MFRRPLYLKFDTNLKQLNEKLNLLRRCKRCGQMTSYKKRALRQPQEDRSFSWYSRADPPPWYGRILRRRNVCALIRAGMSPPGGQLVSPKADRMTRGHLEGPLGKLNTAANISPVPEPHRSPRELRFKYVSRHGG